MKKLAFLFVAFAAISFASCGNKTAQAEACGINYDSLVDMVLHSAGLNK